MRNTYLLDLRLQLTYHSVRGGRRKPDRRCKSRGRESDNVRLDLLSVNSNKMISFLPYWEDIKCVFKMSVNCGLKTDYVYICVPPATLSRDKLKSQECWGLNQNLVPETRIPPPQDFRIRTTNKGMARQLER